MSSLRWQIAAGAVLIVAATVVVGTLAGSFDAWVLALIVLAAGTATVSIFVWGSMNVARSIAAVEDAADHVASGDLDQQVYAPATGETRSLAVAFNRMTAALQDRLAELASAHDRMSALLETMGNGVVVVDEDGVIELANHAATEIMGSQLPEGDSVGRRLYDADVLALAEQARVERKRVQQEVELVPGPRYISAIASPLGGGRVLMTFHDLTAVRQLNVTRREFVSNVSHELRNPLAAITALVETLEGGAVSDPERAVDFLRRVRSEIERMTDLINDLLTLSRIESGRDEGRIARADLGATLGEARTAAAQQTPPEVEVVVECEGVPVAQADPLRFRQVVDNLLANALRFTTKGEVRLRAWSDNGQVHLVVSDSGVGIAAEHLPHIFERFYKVDPSRQDPGTGLGLAIVRHIVETAKGSIRVESEPGRGTTFEVTLPSAPQIDAN